MAKKPGLKSCSKCNGEFPATKEHFYAHSQTPDGFHSWCKSCCKEGNKKSIEKKYSTFEGRITTFLRTCKDSAKKRNQEFSLTRQNFLDMWEQQEGLCVYTGLPMELAPATLFSVSVERVDNSVGYTAENTVLVTNAVNRMKSNMEGEDFFHFCKCVTLWLSNKELDLDVEFDKYA